MKTNRLLNAWQIYDRFIAHTNLVHDTKGFWIFRWPETRWTPTMVAEKLERAGLGKVMRRNTDGSVDQLWLNRDVSGADVERLCL